MLATGVVGCPGDTGWGVVGPAVSAAGVPGCGDGRGVPPTLPPVFTETVGVVAWEGEVWFARLNFSLKSFNSVFTCSRDFSPFLTPLSPL